MAHPLERSQLFAGFVFGILALAAVVAPSPATAADPGKQPPARLDLYGDPLPPGALVRLGTVRWRARLARSVAYSPDGKFLATGNTDRTIRIWDPASGRELQRFTGLTTNDVACLVFSPDGRKLASAGYQGSLRLWDLATGKEIRTYQDNLELCLTLAFSSDGKLLLLQDPTSIHCWEVASGKEVPLPRGPEAGSTPLAFSADGRLLASKATDLSVLIWELATGKLLGRIRDYDDEGRLAFSHDGKLLALGSSLNGRIQIWDITTGKKLCQCQGHTKAVSSLVFTNDGKTLASGAEDLTAHLWNPTTGESLREIRGERGSLPAVAVTFAPDGKTLALAGWDGILRLQDVASGKEMVQFEGHRGSVEALAMAPDGKMVLTGGDDGTVRIWESGTGKELHRLTSGLEWVYAVAFSADGKLIAVGTSVNEIKLWDAGTREVRPPLSLPENVYATCLAFSPHGSLLAAGCSDGPIRLWDVAANKEVATLAGETPYHALSFSGDGKMLAGGNEDSTVRIWDVAGARELKKLEGHTDSVHAVAFSADGRLVASASAAWTVQVGEVVTGKERTQIEGRRGMFDRLAFTPDGQLLALGGADGAIRFWQVSTGKEVRVYSGHEGAIKALTFAPDGKTLATASEDMTVLLWDTSVLSQVPPPQAVELTAEEVQYLPARLADTDAVRVYTNLRRFIAAPAQVLPALAATLRPVPPSIFQQLPQLIGELDDDDFKKREAAVARLLELGELAEPAMREALKNKPSLETRRRLETILEKRQNQGASPDLLKTLRGIEVLEHIGTAEARKILKELSEGAPEARITQEAKAALVRLARRS